ncbi:hypothetical protein [Natrinema gelatinilyticum]|uniref:hypothetical protein n=1 Tax=Natrinema gelatinilyticum TaxID=2961571 RepID=UPI0020C24962|nr:hypothetical protein [Natrinema gelatinilyticum]
MVSQQYTRSLTIETTVALPESSLRRSLPTARIDRQLTNHGPKQAVSALEGDGRRAGTDCYPHLRCQSRD